MWEQVTSKLNAMVGPSGTPDTWRESLRNWRKQLRSRARKFSAKRRKTGGGQNPVAELTDFEQQALEVFRIADVEGHSTLRLGSQDANNAKNVPPTPEELPVENLPPAVPEDPNEFTSFCLVVSESPSRTSSRPVVLLPTSRNRDEILELVQQDMRDRRHEQSRLAQSLDNLGNGLTSLAAAIQEMVALQRQHRD
ncbi:uncharacterized protein [Eurosta solidaginis]|uniref:uncharacterized protein n=1 Tax=Eurosta solidaginis TaxID=178769 RepID=UPI003530FD4F